MPVCFTEDSPRYFCCVLTGWEILGINTASCSRKNAHIPGEFEMTTTSSATKSGPFIPLWLKVIFGAVVCVSVLAIGRDILTNPLYTYTAEQFAYTKQMRANIRSGGHLEGAIVELRDGEIGFISRAAADRSSVRIIFPRGKQMYDNVRTSDEGSMYNILSITRASDANYASMREKVLPARKSPL